jgi:dipeptidyl aminopeptidase/acylaminoacyl peptidase
MSVFEPPVQPRPEFAEELWERLADELEHPARRAPRRTLLLAAAVVLLVAGMASATYLGIRLLTGHRGEQPAQLTAITGSTVVALTPSGPRVVWHCPRPVFCGDLESLDWTRDGRRVAFTLDEVGGTSAYVGLHIVDVRTGRDLHLPRLRLAQPLRPHQPKAVLQRELKAMAAQLGCLPLDIAWSPNNRRLAYGCGSTFGPTGHSGVLFTIDPEGRHRKAIPTGTAAAFSPSWSPDGSRIVFATAARPTQTVAVHPTVTVHSNLYVLGVNGGSRRLLAHDASAPDWSPNGQAIAYATVHGIRLITPGGRDITPGRGLPHGIPRWSPDGTQLAVQTAHGMFVYDTHTWQPHRLTRTAFGGIFATGRPAWYPGPFAPLVRSLQGGRCDLCF